MVFSKLSHKEILLLEKFVKTIHNHTSLHAFPPALTCTWPLLVPMIYVDTHSETLRVRNVA